MATLEWEVLDTSGVAWEVQDGLGVSWLVQTGPVEITGSTGGGSGDVVGPSSVTADRPTVFDGTTGKLLKQGTAIGAGLVNAADAAAARTALGLGTAATSATGDFAAASHTHAASDVTSGAFAAARLAAGTATDGYVIKSASGTPTWAAESGGGSTDTTVVRLYETNQNTATDFLGPGIPEGSYIILNGQTTTSQNGLYTATSTGGVTGRTDIYTVANYGRIFNVLQVIGDKADAAINANYTALPGPHANSLHVQYTVGTEDGSTFVLWPVTLSYQAIATLTGKAFPPAFADTAINADYQATINDVLISVDSSAGDVDLTLGPHATIVRPLWIHHRTGSNVLTVVNYPGDGDPFSITIPPGEHRLILPDGAAWIEWRMPQSTDDLPYNGSTSATEAIDSKVARPVSATNGNLASFSGSGSTIGDSGYSSSSFAAASHTHAAGDITSGTLGTARLGSGTANSTTFLRGDQTWATPAGGDLTHVASVGAQTQITEAATGFATAGTNATVLDSAITLPACAAGDVIQFVAGITYTNSSGASRTPRPGFRLGSTNVTIGTLVSTGNVSSGTTCSWIVRGTINVLTTTSQELIVEVLGDGSNTSNQGARTAATVDMAGTSSLRVTFGTNNASGTQTARLLSAHVTKVTA